MLITVTQQHIDDGIIECESCPISLALIDAGCIEPFVSDDVVAFRLKGKRRRITASPPMAAVKFIHKFDALGKVKPFSFELEIPA